MGETKIIIKISPTLSENMARGLVAQYVQEHSMEGTISCDELQQYTDWLFGKRKAIVVDDIIIYPGKNAHVDYSDKYEMD